MAFDADSRLRHHTKIRFEKLYIWLLVFLSWIQVIIMTNMKYSMLLIILLLIFSSAVIIARPVKPITVARRALEVQFEKMNQSKNDWPARVSPGGPDGHHHLKHLWSQISTFESWFKNVSWGNYIFSVLYGKEIGYCRFELGLVDNACNISLPRSKISMNLFALFLFKCQYFIFLPISQIPINLRIAVLVTHLFLRSLIEQIMLV